MRLCLLRDEARYTFLLNKPNNNGRKQQRSAAYGAATTHDWLSANLPYRSDPNSLCQCREKEQWHGSRRFYNRPSGIRILLGTYTRLYPVVSRSTLLIHRSVQTAPWIGDRRSYNIIHWYYCAHCILRINYGICQLSI